MLLIATIAQAGDFRYQASHVTSKSPEQVWEVMTDYARTCSKGCRYKRPDLVVVKKLNFRAKADSWYTWSHVSSTLKEVKYFTHVSITRHADGNITANNRQVGENEKQLIKQLEEQTGLKHSPAFDSGNTKTVTKSRADGKTEMTQIVTLTASGVIAMWAGKIREGMRDNVGWTFENVGN
jgi:hypothetical protein